MKILSRSVGLDSLQSTYAINPALNLICLKGMFQLMNGINLLETYPQRICEINGFCLSLFSDDGGTVRRKCSEITGNWDSI